MAVRYAGRQAAEKFLAQPIHVLGVIGYGSARPDFLPAGCPFVAAPLSPAAGGTMFEIWTSASATRPARIGPVSGTTGGDLAFGTVTLDESSAATLEAVVETAYLAIFDFLDATGFAAPVRFWNYLTAITGHDRGLERYMRFNIGRHHAFSARLRQPVPPAASALGAHRHPSVIYFLAAREPPEAIENPRQISAYAYPPIYGPRSPSFSRASLLAQRSYNTLFISGTASIVGHETCHSDNLSAQIAETIENLRALIGAANERAASPSGAGWALKIYLRDPAHEAEVDSAITALFGQTSQRLYLAAEICRQGLLLEIEAFCH